MFVFVRIAAIVKPCLKEWFLCHFPTGFNLLDWAWFQETRNKHLFPLRTPVVFSGGFLVWRQLRRSNLEITSRFTYYGCMIMNNINRENECL